MKEGTYFGYHGVICSHLELNFWISSSSTWVFTFHSFTQPYLLSSCHVFNIILSVGAWGRIFAKGAHSTISLIPRDLMWPTQPKEYSRDVEMLLLRLDDSTLLSGLALGTPLHAVRKPNTVAMWRGPMWVFQPAAQLRSQLTARINF